MDRNVATLADRFRAQWPAPGPGQPWNWAGQRRGLPYLVALLAVALFTGLIALLRLPLPGAHLAILYLLPVLALASRWGRGPAILASLASFLAYEFSFVEPVFTFSIRDPDEWLALLVFLFTSLVGGQLAAALRLRAEEARAREATGVLLLGQLALAQDARAREARARAELTGTLHELTQALIADRPLDQVDREVLQRNLFQRRQGAHRATPEERLLRLPRREPRPQTLHARVGAQPLLELEPERLALLVQRLGLARIGRHEQLGFEVDERGGHDQVSAGGLEVAELDRFEVCQVLVGDRPHRQARQVDLVGAAQMQQQVERALEVPHAEREVPGRVEDLRRVRRHGVRFTAARTSSIVACATVRARLPPSCRMSTITSGRSANFVRRSRIPSSFGTR